MVMATKVLYNSSAISMETEQQELCWGLVPQATPHLLLHLGLVPKPHPICCSIWDWYPQATPHYHPHRCVQLS